MHELGIITNIFTILEQVAAEHRLTRIHTVRLKLGKLQQIVPDMLVFAFETVAKDTVAEGAALEVEDVPIVMRCQSCEHEFIVDDHCYICPRCEHTGLTMLSGMEILLESVEGDQEGDINGN